ncbi:MFS general substrate transporter [Trichodelitschia bisporula]|uniref:MFS general substrate transporter n=1 Tax=Trichodelitschia bisporula TaxID=703511 RepID=A0A6G1HWP5_9PEZI|nr:MFS general substrate transporter [Trichodelitschia bisporula]
MKNDRDSRPEPKLPIQQLTVLSILRLAEPIALTSVFPYLPEMIESFGVHSTDVAKWTGITSAIFSISQCLTAIPWGRASDKYGRKPIILLAMTCALTSSLFFGFSTSLRWAIIARALSGASNGNVGILRTTVAEMVPEKSLQPRAFSTLPLIWQVGSIVGPILGGSLASPASKMPEIFGNSKFLRKYPFALPNLVNSVFFAIGLSAGIFFLKESLETKKHRRDYGRMLGRYITRPFSRGYKALPSDDFDGGYAAKHPKTPPVPPPSYRSVFTRQSCITLAAYTILALHGSAHDQLITVYMHLAPANPATTPKDAFLPGGFGLDSGRIGILFTIYGIFSMVAQFAVFPPVASRYGALKCFRLCTIVFPLMYMATPFTILAPTPFLKEVSLLAVMMTKAMAAVFAFPCVTILMTNSASSLRVLGTLNGVATALSAVGRACGPYMSGRAFTWGIEHGNGCAGWAVLAVCAVPGHFITYWLRDQPGFGEEKDEGIKLEDRREMEEAFREGEFEVGDDEGEDIEAQDAPLLSEAAREKEWRG